MERRKRLDELILMAQAGDEEAFANMILYIKDDLYKNVMRYQKHK